VHGLTRIAAAVPIRDALRAQFPTMCITREAAHAFAVTASGKSPRIVALLPTLLDKARHSPLGLLRCAQLRALGVDAHHAPLVSQHLLPPVQFADADEELLLLNAVRFLVAQHMFSAHDASSAAAPALSVAPLQDEAVVMLADLSFFLDAQMRAAEARRQPLRDAFSFSGRTLASVTSLAAQHRRQTLVDAAPCGCRVGTPEDLAGEWRGHVLPWDEECARMLMLRCGVMHLLDLSWCADVQLARAGSSDRSATTTLRGEWRMARLSTPDAICKEGREQNNCLHHEDGRFLSHFSSYWSLRFTPDADAEAQLVTDQELRRSAAQLRLTVELNDESVLQAYASHNAKPPLAALQALAEWGRRASSHVPSYLGDEDDEDGEDV
jgi:hypothetical protein